MTTTGAVEVGRRQRIADRLLARLLGLRPATTDYTVSKDLPVPMRDGVVLLADHYAPVGKAHGTVLIRSPYGWDGPTSALYRAQFPTHGYHLVLVRCRGTFGSGGVFTPMHDDIDDGADTVAWLREQPWFEGRFATVGGSYMGYTQFALLMDPPPELAAVSIQVGLHDPARTVHSDGAFKLVDFLGWSESIVFQERMNFLRLLIRSLTTKRRRAPAMATLPLADAADELCEGQAPWFRDWVRHADPDGPYWAPINASTALDRVQVPVLLHAGWQDLFLEQSIEQYTRLRDRGVDVALTIGPWTHLQAGIQGGRQVNPESLDWLDEHLAGIRPRRRRARVRVYVTGADEWRELPDLPAYSGEMALYPLPGGVLGERPATGDAAPAEFTYDPTDPTPSIGGRILASGAGYRNDSALVARSDVLAFTGAPLSADVEVAGCPVVELAHTTDNPHVDLFVRISEVNGRGRSRNVSDSFLRVSSGQADGVIRLELDRVAHRFRAGRRIRLIVAGGAFPRWDRNLGTGEDPTTATTLRPSRRAIDLAASRVLLPVEYAPGSP